MKKNKPSQILEELRKKLKQAEAERDRWHKAIGEAAGTNSDWHDNAGYEYACQQFELYQALVADLKQELLIAQKNDRT